MPGKNAFRAADIRSCIGCFTCLGKPCGATGRATAVCCGTLVNNCRNCCCGCGSCFASLWHCLVGLCGSMLKFALVLALLLLGGFLVFVYWDDITEAASGARNATMELYDKVEHDPNVLEFVNKTSGYYDEAKDKIVAGIEQVGNHPGVQQFANQTAEFYGKAQQSVSDTFGSIKNDDNVAQVINGTVGFFSKIKDKLWG